MSKGPIPWVGYQMRMEPRLFNRFKAFCHASSARTMNAMLAALVTIAVSGGIDIDAINEALEKAQKKRE